MEGPAPEMDEKEVQDRWWECLFLKGNSNIQKPAEPGNPEAETRKSEALPFTDTKKEW